MSKALNNSELRALQRGGRFRGDVEALIATVDAQSQEIERLRGAIWKFVNCHAHSCPRCTPYAIAALEPGNS